MTAPSVFISSTHYDLRYLRSALEVFVRSQGFQPILSENGEIPYAPDIALDESCYRAAAQADIFVLILGGRYGSAASTISGDQDVHRFESITKREYEAAWTAGIPIYIAIEQGVYAEYRTFTVNRERYDVKYAHVDRVEVFHFIEEILKRPSRNPVLAFETHDQIEAWLRSQWAGLFKELLSRISHQAQLLSLSQQVKELAESNTTLKRYLEEVVMQVSPQASQAIISEERERLATATEDARLEANRFARLVLRRSDLELASLRQELARATSIDSLLKSLRPAWHDEFGDDFTVFEDHRDDLRKDINAARAILRLSPIDWRTSRAS